MPSLSKILSDVTFCGVRSVYIWWGQGGWSGWLVRVVGGGEWLMTGGLMLNTRCWILVCEE